MGYAGDAGDAGDGDGAGGAGGEYEGCAGDAGDAGDGYGAVDTSKSIAETRPPNCSIRCSGLDFRRLAIHGDHIRRVRQTTESARGDCACGDCACGKVGVSYHSE